MSSGYCRSGMGISKHRKSGTSGKSPKLLHRLKLEAERLNRKSRKSKGMKSSVKELFKNYD